MRRCEGATKEWGPGVSNKPVAAAAFVHGVVGLNGAKAKDYLGDAMSFSTSAGFISASYTKPLGAPIDSKSFLEGGIAISPKGLGGATEGCVTKVEAEGFILTNPLQKTGEWWGNYLYDVLHK